MPVQFGDTPDGRRRAMTVGLMALNNAEFALELAPGVDEAAAANVLTYIGDYIARSGQRIQVGETMRYGWTTLRFAPSYAPAVLLVEELANPFAPTSEQFSPGVGRVITLLAEQDAAVRRNGLAAAGHHPHRSETAVVCSHVAPGLPRKAMVFDRSKALREDDSGWFVGCGDPKHNHNDPSQLALVHLLHLVELDPRIIAYLALPEGSRVVFERQRVIVFGPGEQEGRLDATVAPGA